MKHGEKFTHEGKTYTYYAPDAPVIFDPPVEALVLDRDGEKYLNRRVGVFDPRHHFSASIVESGGFVNMALPAPDDYDELMTNEELAELLACGYGMAQQNGEFCYTYSGFYICNASYEVHVSCNIKRFRTAEWTKPTKRVYREFMTEIGRAVK